MVSIFRKLSYPYTCKATRQCSCFTGVKMPPGSSIACSPSPWSSYLQLTWVIANLAQVCFGPGYLLSINKVVGANVLIGVYLHLVWSIAIFELTEWTLSIDTMYYFDIQVGQYYIIPGFGMKTSYSNYSLSLTSCFDMNGPDTSCINLKYVLSTKVNNRNLLLESENIAKTLGLSLAILVNYILDYLRHPM